MTPPVTTTEGELVGRERELEILRAALLARRPAMVGVIAPPGMGKSTLLRVVQDEAREAGWNTIPADPRGVMTIGERTDLDDLWTVWTASGVADDAWAGDVLSGATAPERVPDLQAWVDALALRAPVVIALDGFRPSPDLLAWLVGLFGQLRRSGLEAVTIAATEPEHRDVMEALAPDELLELEPLRPEAVEAAILRVATGPARPDSDELATYVAALSREPVLLPPFTRLMRLLAAESGRGAAA